MTQEVTILGTLLWCIPPTVVGMAVCGFLLWFMNKEDEK